MPMLRNAQEWFKARKTRIQTRYSDDNGQYAFRVTVEEQPFIVVAKKYLHDGQASFMAGKVVQRAIDSGAFLLLFTSHKRLVFDPRTVWERGTHGSAERDDRAARGETWVDVDSDLGVSFEEWYDRRLMPPTVDDTHP